ncbi:MAG: hypothetical protein RLO81_15710 [Fulvivirga sp.]|uniref:hypothetical protein n=1 Tax=Fulvivirga sp. TaxID=1931237 RepID=UPI0032EC8BA3
MDCLIDSVITLLAKQGQNPKAIRRYIRMKYRINMDVKSIKQRLNRIKANMQIDRSLQANT